MSRRPRVEIVTADDDCSRAGGRSGAFELLRDPNLVAVVGTSCSGAAWGATVGLCDSSIPLISSSATAPSLTDPATHPSCFLRTAFNDKRQGAAMASYMWNLGKRYAATVHDGESYPQELQRAFADSFVALGGTITAQVAVAKDTTDFATALNAIATDPDGKPDVIFSPFYTAATQESFVAQASTYSALAGVTLSAGDNALNDTFKVTTGAEGSFASGPATPTTPEYSAFLTAYTARFGAPAAPFHAHAYGAANMVLDAIEQVYYLDGTDVVIPRAALVDALFAVKDYRGVATEYTCDAYGDCNPSEQIGIFKVQGGAWVQVAP